MPDRYAFTLPVRSYEIDAEGKVPPAVFLRWFQEAAIKGSAANGYGPAQYAELGSSWYVREFHVEILALPKTGATVTLTTWVGDMERITSHRQYTAHGADGAELARGEADWVYVDRITGRPRRLDPEIMDAFPRLDVFALPDREWGSSLLEAPFPSDVSFASTHKVVWSEIDGSRHVNNTVYAVWLQDDCGEFLPGQRIKRVRITYRRPALFGETLVRELAPAGSDLWLHRVTVDKTQEIVSVSAIQMSPSSSCSEQEPPTV
jgi:acyl-CoA thioester hydrolase